MWPKDKFFLVVGFLVFSISVSLFLLGANHASADPSLIASYSFNEGSGTTLNDLSGNNNNGTISGAAWTTDGKYGNALSFDGVNDKITVADSASLDLTSGMTLMAWVNPTAINSDWRTIIAKERGTTSISYGLYSTDGPNRPPAGYVNQGSQYVVVAPSNLQLNAWTHLAVTYNSSIMRFYVNGNQVATRSVSGNIVTSNSPLAIGGNNIWGEWFSGKIDEIRIYNRELSSSEIQTDLNVPLGAPDTTPPAVSLTAPIDGSTVTASISINADASDNIGVAGVQFLLDGNNLGAEDISAPYSIAWDTFQVTAGSHVLSARARDAAGNTTVSATLTVTVVPQLVIIEPLNNASVNSGTVTIRYRADGDATGAQVDHVHMILDNNPYIPDLDFDGVMQFNNVAPGPHTINGFLVRANHSTIIGSNAATINFTAVAPDTTPPTISITNPAQGASVAGTVNVSANASDDVGVFGVQFKLNGINLGAEDTLAPYSISWDTTTVANGPHILTAVARDAVSNSTTSNAVDVTVNNVDIRSQIGEWSAPFNMSVVAVHQALMPTGEVLMWDAGDFTSEPPQLWNPQTGAFVEASQNTTDLFCSGHTMLADGTMLTIGGDSRSTGLGVRDINRFNPFTRTWAQMSPMAYKRWYPTGITLADGRVLVQSGYEDAYDPAELLGPLEIYNPQTNTWTTLPASADYTIPSYPFLFGLPDGKVLNAGSYEGNTDTRVLDLNTNTWSIIDPTLLDSGSAVMYEPGKVMKSGIADLPPSASHARTYVIDMNQPSPLWRQTASMNFPRGYHVLTQLPDGSVAVTGGSRMVDATNASQAVLEAEIWNPLTETWTTMAQAQNPRLYHGSAILLPDGRILVAGSGRYGSTEQFNGEIFSPPYLFKGARPSISSVSSQLNYGQQVFVGTPDGSSIQKVTLVRTGTMTHSFNPDQRFLDLEFTQTAGGLTVTTPANSNLAPPGYYLIFLVNANGVPSIGSFVRFPASYEDNQPPTAPSNLSATGSIGQASLAWGASTDNIGVAKYNMHRSAVSGFSPNAGNKIGESVSLSYNDTVSPGTYYYLVTAEDAAGNVSPPSNEALAVVTSDGIPPSVNITSPTNGATVTGSVTVSADASDSIGVAGVQFLLDGNNLNAEDTASPYSINWNTAQASNGSHILTAIARDAAGNITTSAGVTVTVDNFVDTESPSSSITSPANNSTVSGTISLTANASDNVGVAGVQFLLDGNNLNAEDTASPYSINWNTTTATNGSHALTARARDAAGNTTTSSVVTVTVSNQAATGIVASYSFNEGLGAALNDLSGNNNNGTISGAAWTTSGKYGGALSFDGANDKVSVADSSSLDLTSGMTLMAWVSPTAINSDWRTIIAKERGTTSISYGLYATDGPNRPPVGYINQGSQYNVVAPSNLQLNAWTHLAVTYNSSIMRFYVNGNQVATRSVGGNIVISNGSLEIGGNNIWGEWFSGKIDEIRIYNRELNATEIQTDMNAPL